MALGGDIEPQPNAAVLQSMPALHLSSDFDLNRSEPQRKVKADLCRLARFGANLCDAHSCFIFLPMNCFSRLTCSAMGEDAQISRYLILAGYHSLSNAVAANCILPRGSGLIGWVAKHNRSIHVSPFELDSRTLGIYNGDQELKSFIGIPIAFRCLQEEGENAVGVLACDSKKSFAFSKLQGKLLEDLAREITNTLELLQLYSAQTRMDIAWRTFVRRGEELIAALGPHSIEALRLRLLNFDQLEITLGTTAAQELLDQIYRLVQQALPAHFPLTRLLNGDLLLCLDNMMSSFYENKIQAIVEHVSPSRIRPHFEFSRASLRQLKYGSASIESLIRGTVALNDSEEVVVLLSKELEHGRRRA